MNCMEGTVSQIFILGPGFYFATKSIHEKYNKLYALFIDLTLMIIKREFPFFSLKS